MAGLLHDHGEIPEIARLSLEQHGEHEANARGFGRVFAQIEAKAQCAAGVVVKRDYQFTELSAIGIFPRFHADHAVLAALVFGVRDVREIAINEIALDLFELRGYVTGMTVC